jgi:hypothetical protein
MREYLSCDLCHGAYDVGLTIGNQGFNIRTYSTNKKSIAFFKRALAQALSKLIDLEKSKG